MSPLNGRVKLEDSDVRKGARGVVREGITQEGIPRNSLRSPEVVHDLGSDLLWRMHGLADRISTQEERPVRSSRRVPRIRRVLEGAVRGRVSRTTSRNNRLLN